MKPLNFDKAVAQHFDRAAISYTQHDEIQRRAAHDLLACAKPAIPQSTGTLVDIGCGPAAETATLLSRCQHYIGIDISPAMLVQARRLYPGLNWAHGHWTELPLASASTDWAFANLSLQWVDDLSCAFNEVYRILKPGGVATVNTLLPGTFSSLQESWARVDSRPHINQFPLLTDVVSAVKKHAWSSAGFHDYSYTQYFNNLRELLGSIKGVGASLVKRESSSGLTTRSKLQNLEKSYEIFRQSQGLPLEWQIINIVLVK
ncbi:biotin synthase [Idiomarina sp. X4]|uniref:methyltransferase domain-containing protein n=1 Tax=Idiomarina sp. X4 TaxID=2055892 RepID=UPI000C295864|nr:L-histidine N(alpha)-methyltransferase [Idiomarina sp. X4]ATZ74328.1 biotin synthase [Idiomarina sp. X4]